MMKFKVLGIPVTVDPFFFIGLLLIWSWAGSNRVGLFAAAFVAVFTLVHELGHALTARHFGASTAIQMNLLVGWASYAAPRPLTRRERNLISLAGPLTQLALALPVLYLTYATLPDGPKAIDSVQFDLWQAAIWAGIVIGLLNLLPLWPLDGGHVLDSFIPRRVMLIGTLVVVGVVAALGLAGQNPSLPYNGIEREVVRSAYAPLAAFDHSFFGAVWEQIRAFPGHVLDFPLLLLVFCGLNSFLALQRLGHHDRVATWMDVEQAPTGRRKGAGRSPDVGVPKAAAEAERTGWLDGVVVKFPSGWGPSPWLSAYLSVHAGRLDDARPYLATVTSAGRPRWALPEPADRPELAVLMPLLPDPIPLGEAGRNLTALRVLAAFGTAEQVARFGITLYNATSSPEVLYLVASGFARTGHGDDAMAWLRRAVQDQPDHQRLATDRGLWPLHGRSDYQQLLVETRTRR